MHRNKNIPDRIHQQYSKENIEEPKKQQIKFELYEIFEEADSNITDSNVAERDSDKGIFYFHR